MISRSQVHVRAETGCALMPPDRDLRTPNMIHLASAAKRQIAIFYVYDCPVDLRQVEAMESWSTLVCHM